MSRRSSEKNERGPRRKRGTVDYVLNDYDGTIALLQLALGATLVGGAVRIGFTRDGGALALGMYMGEDYATEYIRPSEDLSMIVRELSVAWGMPLAYWDDEAQVWKVQ